MPQTPLSTVTCTVQSILVDDSTSTAATPPPPHSRSQATLSASSAESPLMRMNILPGFFTLFISSLFLSRILVFGAITESYTKLHQCYEEPKLDEILLSSSINRILISIPFYMIDETHDHRHPHYINYYEELFNVLNTYLYTYPDYYIDIFIDTNSKSAINKIASLYTTNTTSSSGGSGSSSGGNSHGPIPSNKRILYQYWTKDDFIKLTLHPNAMFPKNFNEYHLLLSHVHRLYLHHYRHNYQYFIYTEHDMILSYQSFQLYTQRYRELWNLNWLYSFYRYDIKLENNEEYLEIFDEVVNAPVYITPSGNKYVFARFTSYTGMWILDYEQLNNFYHTPYYRSGSYGREFQYNLSPRERVAFGYNYGDFNNSYFARMLIPLIEDKKLNKILLDPLAGIHHSSNKYIHQLKYRAKDGTGYRWDNIDSIIQPLPCLVNTRPDYIEKGDLS